MKIIIALVLLSLSACASSSGGAFSRGFAQAYNGGGQTMQCRPNGFGSGLNCSQ